jgi:hypothetical protein
MRDLSNKMSASVTIFSPLVIMNYPAFIGCM